MNRVFFVALITSLILAACNRAKTSSVPVAEPKSQDSTMAMSLTSTAFHDGAIIPKDYTCDGRDLSPPLAWSNVPPGTKSFALICDDPDAPMGTWTHWVLWGLPVTTRSLPEEVHPDTPLPGNAKQGLNSFRRIGYGSPCPPPGNAHRYFFKLYALDAVIKPPDGADKGALERAMEGHVLDVAQLVGRYGRGKR